MVGSQDVVKAGSYCTFCPAGCELHVAAGGPDSWHSEVDLAAGAGLCPRGSALGELLGHRRRILQAARRRDGRRQPVELRTALGNILQAAGEAELIFLLDPNAPVEQIAAAAAWCAAWPRAKLCLAVEPADEQLLLGAEAAAAEYLTDEALADCDGFLIVGDAFAANCRCCRGVFDRRAAEPRTPIVVLDAASGTASKFATVRVDVAAGGEAQALRAIAAGAGVELDWPAADSAPPTAAAAGRALASCRRLGVIVAAEYARSSAWRQIGYLAGRIAKALGGGLACQTAGAGALSALRMAAAHGAIGLAEAMSSDSAVRIAIGCDVLGMLGWPGPPMLAAAAALPNATTAGAEFVLPVALSVELGGTVMRGGQTPVPAKPLLPAPAGVPAPAEIIEQLARLAKVPPPTAPARPAPPPRLPAEAPQPPAPAGEAPPLALLFGRQARQAGCGALTGHGSWQAAGSGPMGLRISPADAARLGADNLADVSVRAGDRSIAARVTIARELPGGAVVLPAGSAKARALAPLKIDTHRHALVGEPPAVTVEA